MSVRFSRYATRGGWVTFNVQGEDADEAERRLRGETEQATEALRAQRLELAQQIAAMAHDLQAVDQLLAVIHRDGGHYQAEHGRAKAIWDGMQVIHALRAGRDEA